MDAVRDGLNKAGIDPELLWPQRSNCAATTAATKGVDDSIIKTLGRWERLAYLYKSSTQSASWNFKSPCQLIC